MAFTKTRIIVIDNIIKQKHKKYKCFGSVIFTFHTNEILKGHYGLLLIDYTILYVKLITFHGLYDTLSTNIQRQLGQYEKTPANMEKLSQYEIQPIRCEH